MNLHNKEKHLHSPTWESPDYRRLPGQSLLAYNIPCKEISDIDAEGLRLEIEG
jgi:hypothetical protein